MHKRGYVHGRGINDVNFPVFVRDDEGRGQELKPYRIWRHMLERCYVKKTQQKFPSYKKCSVCDEWLIFSAFFKWYKSQDKEPDAHLDKDLLFPGNKVYSPRACVLIPRRLNNFITDRAADRGEFMIGVSWHKHIKKFTAQCSDPFTGKRGCLGYFTSEMDAHVAWRERKHDLACQYADTVTDPRIAAALRSRYESA